MPDMDKVKQTHSFRRQNQYVNIAFLFLLPSYITSEYACSSYFVFFKNFYNFRLYFFFFSIFFMFFFFLLSFNSSSVFFIFSDSSGLDRFIPKYILFLETF